MKKLKLALLSALSTVMLAPVAYSKTSAILLLDRSASMKRPYSMTETRCMHAVNVAISKVHTFFKNNRDGELKVKTFLDSGRSRDMTDFVGEDAAVDALNKLLFPCEESASALAEAMCISADELRARAKTGDQLKVITVSDGEENDSYASECGNEEWQNKVMDKYTQSPMITVDSMIFDQGPFILPFPIVEREWAPNKVEPSPGSRPYNEYPVWLSYQTGGTAIYHYDDYITEVGTTPTDPITIKAKQGTQSTNQVDVELELWNNKFQSSDTVALNDVTIRYYFNSNPKLQYKGDIWYYDVSGPKPKIRCASQMSTGDGGNQFCDIIFDKDAPELAANSHVSVEAVFYAEPRLTEITHDDYSNPANATEFKTNKKIVVYKDSKKVWGEEAQRPVSPINIESYDARTYSHVIEPVIYLDNKAYYHPVPLKDLKLRYYFYSTVGAANIYTAEMWYDDAPGDITPTVSCHDMAVPVYSRTDMANMYCEVSFPGGDYLNPLYNEFHVDFAAWAGGWGQFSQSQVYDWSWNGINREVNKRIVAFYEGAIMWGELPK